MFAAVTVGRTGVAAATGLAGLVAVALLFGAARRRPTPAQLERTIVIAGLAAHVVLILLVPTFQAPDEREHVDYVTFVQQRHHLPHVRDVSHAGELHQAPLAYVTLAPVRAIADAVDGHRTAVTVRVLRAIGIGGWWIVVLATRRVLRRRRPGDLADLVALAVAALLPTWLVVSSSVTNDVFADAFGALVVAGAAGLATTAPAATRRALTLGVTLAAAIASKVMAAPLALAVIADGIARRGEAAARARMMAVGSVVVAALLTAPMLVRNQHLYGDVTAANVSGFRKHWGVVHGLGFTALGFLRTFTAVAGRFNDIHLPGAFLFTVALIVVTALGWWRLARRHELAPLDAVLFVAIAGQLVVVGALGVGYGQPQGRYLFPALPAIATVVGLGVDALWPARWRAHAEAIVAAGAIGFAVVVVTFSVAMMYR